MLSVPLLPTLLPDMFKMILGEDLLEASHYDDRRK